METKTPGMLLPTHLAPEAKRIVLLNSKGGAGKSTLVTNLAGCYASRGYATALYDFDPQGSSMRWLQVRPKDKPPIYGVAAYQATKPGTTRCWQLRVPAETQRIIIDTPAGVTSQQLVELVRSVDNIIVPVLPSPLDIHATTHFIRELLLVGKIRTYGTRVTIVANRVRENTVVYRALQRFLDTLRIPFVTHLRDTQHYIHAAERGLGIHELHSRRTKTDLRLWEPLLDWLEECEPELSVARRPHRSTARPSLTAKSPA